MSCQDQGYILESGDISESAKGCHHRYLLAAAKLLLQFLDAGHQLIMFLATDRNQLLYKSFQIILSGTLSLGSDRRGCFFSVSLALPGIEDRFRLFA